jgi:hypothetical protein
MPPGIDYFPGRFFDLRCYLCDLSLIDPHVSTVHIRGRHNGTIYNVTVHGVLLFCQILMVTQVQGSMVHGSKLTDENCTLLSLIKLTTSVARGGAKL